MTLRFGILTVSDRSSRGERPDASGPVIAAAVQAAGWGVLETGIVPDERPEIERTLAAWADSGCLDIILTTGGTGFAPRDVTPEATLAVIERLAPGIPEAMRAASLRVTPFAMLTRMVAGIRGRVLIINLPGSPKGAKENLDVVLPVLEHAVHLLRDEDAGH